MIYFNSKKNDPISWLIATMFIIWHTYFYFYSGNGDYFRIADVPENVGVLNIY